MIDNEKNVLKNKIPVKNDSKAFECLDTYFACLLSSKKMFFGAFAY